MLHTEIGIPKHDIIDNREGEEGLETRIRTYGDVTDDVPFGYRPHMKISRYHLAIYSMLYRYYFVAVLSCASMWLLSIKVS